MPSTGLVYFPLERGDIEEVDDVEAPMLVLGPGVSWEPHCRPGMLTEAIRSKGSFCLHNLGTAEPHTSCFYSIALCSPNKETKTTTKHQGNKRIKQIPPDLE